MLFWIFAILLSLLAAASVLLPAMRLPLEQDGEIDHDRLLYRARIDEIAKDEKLKRLSKQEAEAARAEEARKLIALADDQVNVSKSKSSLAKLLPFLGAIAIPILAFGIYLPTGNPQMPDQSLASRLKADPNDQSGEELLARAEAHLAKSPNDARGWSVVAPVYSRLGREADAVTAWSHVLRLTPKYPNVRSLLGEAILATTDGVMTDKAFSLFEEEVRLQPSSARARFYMATGLAQAGKHEQSAAAWKELIEGANAQAPWFQTAIGNMNEQRKLAGLPELTDFVKNTPGPTKEQVEAAQNMSEEDRAAMIESMVAGLSDKLKEDPSDTTQWKRLIRAYTVLGKKDEALKAITEASKHHSENQIFITELATFKNQLTSAKNNLK